MDDIQGLSRFMEPLYRSKGWITFAGVLSIIQGVFTILSIWGIIICWIPIWMGILLCSASTHIRLAYETNSEMDYLHSMDKLGTYFRILGIFSLVSLIIGVIAIFAAILIPLLAAATHHGF